MNKATTDDFTFMPPAFRNGLENWSSGSGEPGPSRYDDDPTGNLVAGDDDFGVCLELVKTEPVQTLRHTGQTLIPDGVYLRVQARVKLVSGPSVLVQIAGFASDRNGNAVSDVQKSGKLVSLGTYGEVKTVAAIIGPMACDGVDMAWGKSVEYGHLGLNIVGDNGAVLRVESLEVHDETTAFVGSDDDCVTVSEFGAVGDGVTDDAAAFEAADVAAEGRDIVIPKGCYFLGRSVTLINRARFHGSVLMAEEDALLLCAELDINAYVEAFDEETEGLRRAIQALSLFQGHDGLDLKGRRFRLDQPLDVQGAVRTLTSLGSRRVIRNGQIEAMDTGNWDPEVVTATASYDRDEDQVKLTGIGNIAEIAVGALVEGYGVGREVYVRSVDVANGAVTLSQPLVLARPSQSYTFTRFRYLLDFSGFASVDRFQIENVEFLGNRIGAGILLPPDGASWSVRDCFFARTGHRAITSIGSACKNISIDGNQFVASDDDEKVQNRRSVAVNINSSNAKIRNNKAVQHRHFLVAAGGGHIIMGNHFWQEDTEALGDRSAGIVLMTMNPKSVLLGNYCDNATIDITNEYDPFPAPFAGKPAFGSLSITGNIFSASNVPAWFTFIRLLPIGTGHPVDGIIVTDNIFKGIAGANITRVESVDTSRGGLDHSQTRALIFDDNTFTDITYRTQSPALVELSEVDAKSSWSRSLETVLPFGGRAVGAEGLTALGTIQTEANSARWTLPVVDLEQGTEGNEISVRWSEAVKGRVQLRVRSDIPD